MRTYRAGSLTLTNASTTIVGVGTAFVANVAIGDIIVIENGQCLEVVSVPDDTHLTVSSAAKESGSFNYAALRFVMAVNFRDLSIKIEQFLSDRQFSLGEFSDWMSGTRTGGPNSDGRYPLTDRNGVTKLFMCPELIAFGYQDSIDQATAAATSATAALNSKNAAATSATAAAGSATASASSATAAAGSATAAAGSATAANTSKVNAGTSETNALASKNAAATSETNAATSATASATSATASAGSATAAASSATAANTSKNNAATSETNANTSKNAAATSATNAATSETNALASKNAAATSATNAGSSETAANTSKLAAAASATAAGTSEANALTSKNAAAASATAADGSKTAAATSATAAAGSATAAATSATAASGSATAAAGSATAANTSKVNAGTSETNALASKNAAATSETNAATSATNAATSASDAAGSAAGAAGSATAALTSKNAAATSAAEALASASSAAAGSLSGLDKMPGNLISNPTFISTASLFTTDVTNGKVSYVDSTDVSVPAGCPVARVGVSLKKVASVLLTHAFPLVNAESRIPCIPGEKFDVCIWMNVVGGLSTGSACARLTFVESDAVAGGTFVANTRVLSYDQVAGGWQKLSGTFTASATTRSFIIGVWNETAMPVNGTIFFGEPELTRRNSIVAAVANMTGFGPGNTAANIMPAGTDLNNMQTPGSYGQNFTANATLVLNYPAARAGTLLVQRAASNMITQTYIDYANGQSWIRSLYNTTWSTWLKTAVENGFTALSNSAADVTTVPSSSDGTQVTPTVRVSGNSAGSQNTIAVQGYSFSTANFGASFVGTRSQGAVGAHGAVPTGRSVCTLVGAASDGTDYRKIGRIDFYTEETATPTSSAGSVRVLTTPVGGVLPTLTATFTNDGRLLVVGGGTFGGNLTVTGDIAATGGKSITSDYRMGVNRNGSLPYMTFSRTDLLDGAPPVTDQQVMQIQGRTGSTNSDFASGRLLGSVNVNYKTTGGGVAILQARNAAGVTGASVVADGDLATVSITGALIAAGRIDEAATVTIASNTTTNIATAASNTITVTGTVAIGSLGTATAGVRRQVKFAGALALAHNATSLILPTGANIATAANDVADFLSLGGGNWICTGYQRANGKAFGLDNVDNTSDVNKPISTATATALAAKVQMGTGIGQLTNAVKIGYTSGNEVKITIDSTDMGAIVFKSFLANSATIAANQASVANQLVCRDSSGNITATGIYGTLMELGRTDSVASTPTIDFHSGATAVDYDARILSDVPTGVTGAGRLRYFADGGHIFQGLGQFSGTLNGVGGVYDGGSRVWSATNFNPDNKMKGTYGGLGLVNSISAPLYNNYSVAQQVYNGAIEIREAGLVQQAGPAPAHVYNAPGITFYWAGHYVNKLMMGANGHLLWGDPAGSYTTIAMNGNVNGGAWGGWLSTYLSDYFLQKGSTMLQIAAMSDCTAIGGIALMKNVYGSPIGLNSAVYASALAWSDSSAANYGAPQGTWKSMGYVAANNVGIFMRIA